MKSGADKEKSPPPQERHDYLTKQLCAWSSHPHALRKRAWRWLFIGLAPLVLGILLFIVAWRIGALNPVAQVANWATWVTVALGLLLLGGAFSLTAVLCVRLSTVKWFRDNKPPAHTLRFPLFVAVAAGTALWGFVLFSAIFGDWPIVGDYLREWRWFGYILCVGPLLAVDSIIDFKGGRICCWGHEHSVEMTLSQNLRRIARRLWRAFVCSIPVLIVGILADGIADFLNKDGWLESMITAVVPSAMANGAKAGFAALTSVVTLVTLIMQAVLLYDLTRVKVADCPWQPTSPSTIARLQGYFLRPSGEAWELNPKRPDMRPEPKRFAEPAPVAARTVLDADTAAAPRPIEKPTVAKRIDQLAENAGVELPQLGPNGEAPAALEAAAPVDAKAFNAVSVPAVAAKKLEDKCPEWMTELLARLSAGDASLKYGRIMRLMATCAPLSSDASNLQHLFLMAAVENGVDSDATEERAPTVDQAEALLQFDTRFEEFLVAEDATGQCVFPSVDMLVSGAEGSGRTTLLLATAVNVAVYRGQSVLVLVPNTKTAESMVTRLRDITNRSGLGWALSCARLTRDETFDWALPDWRPPVGGNAADRWLDPAGILPDILVGTPSDYEQLLYGSDLAHPLVRRALLRLQCVLLEDFSEFTVRERKHLPFLIDKHRLELGAEHLPVQFMALCPEVSDSTAVYLTQRLFSQKSAVLHKKLRPVPTADSEAQSDNGPWVVELEDEHDESRYVQLAEACVAANQEVLVWAPSGQNEALIALEVRLSTPVARCFALNTLDEVGQLEAPKIAVAIYFCDEPRADLSGLRMRLQGNDAVIIRIVNAKRGSQTVRFGESIPVLPSVTSDIFALAHLASAAHHLAPMTPLPRDLFVRLGMQAAGKLSTALESSTEFAADSAQAFELDPEERSAASGYAASRDQVWPWVALRVEHSEKTGRPSIPTKQQVEFYRPESHGRELRITSNMETAIVGKSGAESHSSVASWSTLQGESLDRMDLATCDTLLHERPSANFIPLHIQLDGQQIAIRGLPCTGAESGEAYLPIWDFELVAAPRRGDSSIGGVGKCVLRWSDIKQSADTNAPPPMRVRLIGVFDKIGQDSMRPEPLAIPYRSELGALLIGACKDDDASQVDYAAAFNQLLSRPWSNRRVPSTGMEVGERCRLWPVLTHALGAALRERLRGIFDYARIAAFHAPADGADAGCAIVMFIEPWGTRGTTSAAMTQLLLDARMSRALLEDTRDRLAVLTDSADSDGYRALRVAAKFTMGDHRESSATPKAAVQFAADLAAARNLVGQCLAIIAQRPTRRMD